jgi:transcriptional regulator with XRE-family HTH domain
VLQSRLGQAIRHRRQALHLTQLELGRLTKTDRTRVSKIEAGDFNVTIRTLARFAGSLQISLVDLIKMCEDVGGLDEQRYVH